MEMCKQLKMIFYCRIVIPSVEFAFFRSLSGENMIKIGVGSTNPVKIAASKRVACQVWSEFDILPSDVDSGVSEQPTTDQQALQGARNRAERTYQTTTGLDYAVGLEGSTVERQDIMFVTGWAVIINSDGDETAGAGGQLPLPGYIAQRIREGEELGVIMDEVTDQHNVKEGPGAIGVFTDGLITRTEAYEQAIIFALARYLRPDLY